MSVSDDDREALKNWHSEQANANEEKYQTMAPDDIRKDCTDLDLLRDENRFFRRALKDTLDTLYISLSDQ